MKPYNCVQMIIWNTYLKQYKLFSKKEKKKFRLTLASNNSAKVDLL